MNIDKYKQIELTKRLNRYIDAADIFIDMIKASIVLLYIFVREKEIFSCVS